MHYLYNLYRNRLIHLETLETEIKHRLALSVDLEEFIFLP